VSVCACVHFRMGMRMLVRQLTPLADADKRSAFTSARASQDSLPAVSDINSSMLSHPPRNVSGRRDPPAYGDIHSGNRSVASMSSLWSSSTADKLSNPIAAMAAAAAAAAAARSGGGNGSDGGGAGGGGKPYVNQNGINSALAGARSLRRKSTDE
jgi:hypothetical protein